MADILSSVETPDETKPEKPIHERFVKLTKEERKKFVKLRRQAKQETKKVGQSREGLAITDYYFENDLRKVYPYNFSWNTTSKERWFGRTLYDVYEKEFIRAVAHSNLNDLIKSGKITVDGQIKTNDYIIKNGDRIGCLRHRHEVPVLADEIKIVYNDEDFLAVDKPCSMPIHPCGKYRFNSLLFIMNKEMGLTNLRTMHRLDRLTSGVVIFGKTFKSTLKIDKHIKERTALKTYLSRVKGEFPVGRIIVDKPIECASQKIGIYWVDEKNGKPALTEFERLSYSSSTDTSVVSCHPKTGRTHQIRIHLQYLGHPIINDPLYNAPFLWGANNGKDGIFDITKVQLEANFLKAHTYEAWLIQQEQEENDGLISEETTANVEKEPETIKHEKRKCDDKASIEIVPNKIMKSENEEKNIAAVTTVGPETPLVQKTPTQNRPLFDASLLHTESDCFDCKQTFRDPQRSDLTMYLHALSYKFDELEFKTDPPLWAHENFIF